MNSACVLDCQTDIGVITLIMDKKSPQYLFIQIGGEMRRCYDLGEHAKKFKNDEEVVQFLIEVSNSDFMHQVVEDERKLDQGWDEL